MCVDMLIIAFKNKKTTTKKKKINKKHKEKL